MAGRDQLLAYPITEDIEYRSNINSKNLNMILKSLEESVLRALMKSTEVERQLGMLNLGATSSYLALSRSNQIYNSYPQPYNIPSGQYGGVCYATAFGDISGVRQDKSVGVVTMDWKENKKLSKIPSYQGVISPTVQIYLDSVLRPVGDSIYNILDGDTSTIWIEQAASGLHTLELVLPPSTQKTFNYVEVVPFPIFGMEITKIEYYDFQSNLQTIYPLEDNLFYNGSGPLIMHLTPREFNNTIKITFNVINGLNVMGFTSIDVGSIDYMNNTNTVYIKFDNVPEVDHNNVSITSIRPVGIDLDFYADGVVDDNYNSFISEISLVTSPTTNPNSSLSIPKKRGYQGINTSNASFSVSQPSGPNALYLKVVMNEVNLTTPVIRGAKLDYREIL